MSSAVEGRAQVVEPRRLARRELTLAAVAIIAVARLSEPAPAAISALVLLAAVAVGMGHVLGEGWTLPVGWTEGRRVRGLGGRLRPRDLRWPAARRVGERGSRPPAAGAGGAAARPATGRGAHPPGAHPTASARPFVAARSTAARASEPLPTAPLPPPGTTAPLPGATARPAGIRLASLVLPGLASAAALIALRLIPIGPGLVVALVGAWLIVEASMLVETRVASRSKGPTPQDRASVLALGLLIAFLGFAGVAGLVPGGLVEPVTPDGSGSAVGVPAEIPLSETSLLLLAAGDALVGTLLGYRLAALRAVRGRDAVVSGLGYGAAIAIGAGLLRAVALPRLIGPALLTLVVFLWDAVRGTAPAARRDPRFVWQVVLLGALAVIVVAWNLGLRR